MEDEFDIPEKKEFTEDEEYEICQKHVAAKGRDPEIRHKFKQVVFNYYINYKSAFWTAHHLGVGRHSVEKLFNEFGSYVLNQSKEEFIEKQKINKEMLLSKMDNLITMAEQQLSDVEAMATNSNSDENTVTKYHSLKNKIIGDLFIWYQEKAKLSDTPTMDQSINSIIEERMKSIEKREKTINELEKVNIGDKSNTVHEN